AAETAVKELHLFVHHGVVAYGVDELVLLFLVRQLTVEQQVGRLKKVTLYGELLDRISAIEQLSLVAVDVGDARIARRGRHEAGIVGKGTGFAIELADVDHVGPDGALVDRKLDALGTVRK